MELLRCYYNFVRPHGALKFGREIRTPAMQASLTTRRLTFRDIFFATTIPLWLQIEVFLLSRARNPLSSAPVPLPAVPRPTISLDSDLREYRTGGSRCPEEEIQNRGRRREPVGRPTRRPLARPRRDPQGLTPDHGLCIVKTAPPTKSRTYAPVPSIYSSARPELDRSPVSRDHACMISSFVRARPLARPQTQTLSC